MGDMKDDAIRSWLEIALEDDRDQAIEQTIDDARIPPALRA